MSTPAPAETAKSPKKEEEETLPPVSKASAESLSTTLKTGGSLFLLQFLTRIVTFGLNQSLVRLASPEVFGTAAIQFDLITSTIEFLSREGIRNALLRKSDATSMDEKDADRVTKRSKGVTEPAQADLDQKLRLASVPFFFAMPITAALITIYLYMSGSETTSQTDFHLSLGLYVLAVLLELAIEPMYIRTLTSSPPRLSVRVSAHGGMAIVKAVATFLSLLVLPQRALLGFALGQLAGATWLVARYISAYSSSELAWSRILMSGNNAVPRFDSTALSLAIANTRQSFIKHFLTELDRIAVSRLCTLRDQGGYAVAMNYGSLVARLAFQPLEETLLLHFSSNPLSTVPESRELIVFVTHIVAHILFLCPAFIPPLFPPTAVLLLPHRYLVTSAPFILRRYLEWYIPLMALNGVLEAFHTATATPKEVSLQATWMFFSSAAFVGIIAAATRTHFGQHMSRMLSVGPMGGVEQIIIAASCLSMGIRIIYALLHVKKRVPAFRLVDLVPKSVTSIVITGSGLVLRRGFEMRDWRVDLESKLRMIALGILCGSFVLTIM
ncbi:Rft protein-domain-containing protein [Kockovaella imperatae]|uniref:Man(5)GlcNAc(2)-PP-dolichol translocation protein RFT1 n=1 Tax=Kockovaella imperatae TaxID=4999 RepID=A0A1Y1UP67_9TREE|nr:Rft protein-domain-containing protein [Kockovaella imperatae]ORX39821.1 Rft protein-domain-containing protein [Kockovaella imperatae]